MKRGGLLALLWFAAGCGAYSGVLPASTPVTPVTEQAARGLALTIAQTDDFHFTGATSPVTNVRADVMTFSAALQALDHQQMGCSQDPAAEAGLGWVWVVTMDGSWPQNFPVLATPAPTYAPWRSIAVVLDAANGALVCLGARK
jgi:hypothetical protein